MLAFSSTAGGGIIGAAGGRILWICCTAALVLVTLGLWATKNSREREIARNLTEIDV